LHAGQVFGEVIFASNNSNIGSGVNTLEGSELADSLGLNWHIRPVNIPVGIFVVHEFKVHLTADPLDNIIPTVLDTEKQTLVTSGSFYGFLLLFFFSR